MIEELKEMEERIETSIRKTIDPLCEGMTELTAQMAETNKQVAVMLERLSASKETTDKLEDVQISQGKRIQAVEIDIAKLQTNQSGIMTMIWKLLMPAAIAGLAVVQYLKA